MICSVSDRISSNRSWTYFLLDPGLLRCLLAFGPRQLWLPHSDDTNCSNSEGPSLPPSYGLIPRVLSKISLILKPVPDQWPGLSTLVTVLIDRWQLLPCALTSFRVSQFFSAYLAKTNGMDGHLALCRMFWRNRQGFLTSPRNNSV